MHLFAHGGDGSDGLESFTVARPCLGCEYKIGEGKLAIGVMVT